MNLIKKLWLNEKDKISWQKLGGQIISIAFAIVTASNEGKIDLSSGTAIMASIGFIIFNCGHRDARAK
jgi:hypothetical protein